MNIWFLLWVFLAVFICGVFLWSMQILFQQKRAWADFAKKNSLNIQQIALLKSPIVRGRYKDFETIVYSEEQATADQRGRRFRTIIQLDLGSPMPVEGVVTSADAAAFAHSLADLTQTLVPDAPGWDNSIIVKTSDLGVLRPYLTPERCRSLVALMTIKSISCIFIFDRKASYLRFETPDPFHEMGKLDRMCSKIAEHAKVLKISA